MFAVTVHEEDRGDFEFGLLLVSGSLASCKEFVFERVRDDYADFAGAAYEQKTDAGDDFLEDFYFADLCPFSADRATQLRGSFEYDSSFSLARLFPHRICPVFTIWRSRAEFPHSYF